MSVANITNSKSVLAKLLAQENITVEHRRIHTAAFDPVNRVLILPLWKEMGPDIYDLLVGHEVGHAWETPAEGWHSAIEEKGKGFKSFLNVIEDARIEKKIKTRYPGLRAPMYRGYKLLFDQKFFGVSETNISDLKLIDRLNLHFKIGHLLNVPFSSQEKIYVYRMMQLETWDDVYELACELFDYTKDFESETNFDDIDINQDENENSDSFDLDSYYEFDESVENNDYLKGRFDSTDPESITDKAFRENESSLIDDTLKPYVYVNLPIIKIEDFIVPHRVLYTKTDFSNFDTYFNEHDENSFNKSKLFTEYRERNTKFIMYLVKEFELKRNAAQYARASISKTGELDCEKIWSYKLREDLFKRVTKIPNGKNHGMVMFIDLSGSMTNNITNTIEQTLVLADFCLKVNIPFEVYAFSDSYKNYENYLGHERGSKVRFSRRHKDLVMDNNSFKLLNFLSSTMSKSQYREAQIRLLQYGAAFEYFRKGPDKNGNVSIRYRTAAIPKGWELGGTPLDETILFANYFVEKFKEERKLDIVNTIFLTDGQGVETNALVDENGRGCRFAYLTSSKSFNLILTDTKNKITVSAAPGELVSSALLRMLKARSGSNVVGYFISDRNVRYSTFNILQSYGKFISEDQITSFIRKYKYFDIQNIGFDSYFVITNKDLLIEDDELKVEKTGKNELRKAFIKNQKNKLMNRILLNKFIERIA